MATGVICNTSISSLPSSSPPARTILFTGGLHLTRLVVSYPPLNRKTGGFRWGRAIRPSSPSGMRLSVRCGVETIYQSEFSDKVLRSDLPVLVEFVASWCGPCRLISPIVDWASHEYKDKLKVVKIDHDANPQLIEEYKVYGLPTLILFKAGQEVPESRWEGAMTKVKLKEYLDSLLESATVA